jgi:hypothetical protein
VQDWKWRNSKTDWSSLAHFQMESAGFEEQSARDGRRAPQRGLKQEAGKVQRMDLGTGMLLANGEHFESRER